MTEYPALREQMSLECQDWLDFDLDQTRRVRGPAILVFLARGGAAGAPPVCYLHLFLPFSVRLGEGQLPHLAKGFALLDFLFRLPLPPRAKPNPPQPASSDQQLLKPEELDALLAPIALYPDALLAQI